MPLNFSTHARMRQSDIQSQYPNNSKNKSNN